ncbi:MAG TPA: DUF6502 family protein [Xanthomonadaceae bacterium]|nr:DUF6502 family protein [Xanthomonadaceae bacterium]
MQQLNVKQQAEIRHWESAHKALLNSLKQILRPVVRLMLRNGLSFQAFAEVAKSVFVEVAEAPDVTGPFKPTKARIALLTGMTRPDVRRVMERGDDLPEVERMSRISAILGGWATDPLFLDEDGQPMPLPVTGSGRSFETLVRRFGADLPKATVLDEMLLSGCVEQRQGRLVLMSRTHRSVGDASRISYMGDAFGRFGGSVAHNVLGDGEPRVQREVWSRAIPVERLPEVRAAVRELLSTQIDEAIRVLDQQERLPVLPHHRTAGVGYYYFES